jgi:hypothetical protein
LQHVGAFEPRKIHKTAKRVRFQKLRRLCECHFSHRGFLPLLICMERDKWWARKMCAATRAHTQCVFCEPACPHTRDFMPFFLSAARILLCPLLSSHCRSRGERLNGLLCAAAFVALSGRVFAKTLFHSLERDVYSTFCAPAAGKYMQANSFSPG